MDKFNYYILRLCSACFLFITFNQSVLSQNVLLLTGESIASSKIDNNTDVSKFNDFLNLVYNLNPVAYVNENGINTFLDETPKVVVTSPDNIAPILNGNENLTFRNVELLIIKIDNINDLSSSINLALLRRSFFNLKYIYLESLISITEEDVSSFLRNNRPNFQIIYKLSSQS